jgi:hypothetical protein
MRKMLVRAAVVLAGMASSAWAGGQQVTAQASSVGQSVVVWTARAAEENAAVARYAWSRLAIDGTISAQRALASTKAARSSLNFRSDGGCTYIM